MLGPFSFLSPIVTYACQGLAAPPPTAGAADTSGAAAGVFPIYSWWTMAQHPEPAREHGSLFWVGVFATACFAAILALRLI
jgi:hypothetical protein